MNRIRFKGRDRFGRLPQNRWIYLDKEETTLIKKRKPTRRSKGKPLQYPKLAETEVKSKTFQIKYYGQLSLAAKFILNSFQNKYIYYAMDDILYQFGLKPTEYETLLAILYSPVLSLQNNYFINFFDIWITEVYLKEVSKTNKFLTKTSETYEQISYITIKFVYTTRVPVKKPDPLW